MPLPEPSEQEQSVPSSPTGSPEEVQAYRKYFATWMINKDTGVMFDKATRRLMGYPTATNRTLVDPSTKPLQYVGRQGTLPTSTNLRTTQPIPAFFVDSLREQSRK